MKALAIALVVVAALVVGIWLATRPEPVAVVVAPVASGAVEASVANSRAGTVKACLRARLVPASGGQVARLTVDRGDRVVAGQVLMELWNEDLRARQDLAGSELLAAQSIAEQSCLNAEQARRESDRLRPLRRDRLISEEQLDAAETTARARQAACNASRAQVEVARARRAVAAAELDRTILRAPFAGVVAELTGEVGEYVTPSPPGIPTPPAVDLIDYSCVRVSAPMDEVDAPAVRVGMPVRVTLDAFRDQVFPGRVRRVAPYVVDVEKQARTVEVEVELEDPALAASLLPGYSADIEVVLEARESALRVPTEALLEGGRVLVLEAGSLVERKLRTGLGNWRWTEVVSGLGGGEQVVVSVDRAGVTAGASAVVEAAP